jgi:hypothetical protein
LLDCEVPDDDDELEYIHPLEIGRYEASLTERTPLETVSMELDIAKDFKFLLSGNIVGPNLGHHHALGIGPTLDFALDRKGDLGIH